MDKTSTLITHNLKKAKGQYVSFGVIILLTTLIMNIALVLAFQTFSAYDSRFEELNTADVNFMVPEFLDEGGLLAEIEGIDGVSSVEKHHGIFIPVTVREFADSDFDMNTVFYSIDEKRELNLLELSDSARQGTDTVYIPMYMSRLGGFPVGSDITYSIDGREYTYKVGGIVSEMQYGNYGTGMIGGYFPEEVYEDFAGRHSANAIAEYSLKTADGVELLQVKNDITDILAGRGIAALCIGDREGAKQTRTMVCVLLIVIFLALAVIILAVSIFLSNFRIRSTIEDELAQMGVLKAIGYTGKMIITSTAAPYTVVGIVSAVAGAALSYVILPPVADILAIQSGFSYTPVFDIAALGIAVLLPSAAIWLFSHISAAKIHRLEPIDALRGNTGNGGVGQNVLLSVVAFGIMVLLSFAGTLLYNVSIKPDNFMDTLSEETPSVIFTAKDGKLEELKDVLRGDDRVELVLEYASLPVSYADGSLTAFVCEDFSKITNDICYEGHSPAGGNEIAIGNALAKGYPIGGDIEIKSGGKSAVYTVTGFIQSVNHAGTVCQLTGEGYEKLGEKSDAVNVYLRDGNAGGFIKEYEGARDGLIASSINYEQLSENSRAMYAGIVSVVAVVLFLISVLMVLLVLYVIIGGVISQRRQEFGIYKAIGYTSRQLAIKTACSFIPVVAISSLLSALAGMWYLPVIDNAILGLIGAMKNHFEVSVWVVFTFAIIFTAVAFAISVLLAAPVKKITAYSLLKN